MSLVARRDDSACFCVGDAEHWRVARALLASLLVLVAFVAGTPLAHAQSSELERAELPDEPFRFGILFHIVEEGGAPIVDAAWLAEQLDWAERVFAPTGIGFAEVGRRTVPAEHAHLVSRADRNALARGLRRHVINVFVVQSMRDVNDPTQARRGVHWRIAEDPTRHFLVLCAETAPRTTLAHELGHFFGNRQHSEVAGNIMSYQHGDAPSFDETQLRRIRLAGRRYLQVVELTSSARAVALRERRGELPRWGRWRPLSDPSLLEVRGPLVARRRRATPRGRGPSPEASAPRP